MAGSAENTCREFNVGEKIDEGREGKGEAADERQRPQGIFDGEERGRNCSAETIAPCRDGVPTLAISGQHEASERGRRVGHEDVQLRFAMGGVRDGSHRDYEAVPPYIFSIVCIAIVTTITHLWTTGDRAVQLALAERPPISVQETETH